MTIVQTKLTQIGGGVTIVQTKLTEIQDELAGQFEEVSLKGHAPSALLLVVKKGRPVEISEDNGGLAKRWLR